MELEPEQEASTPDSYIAMEESQVKFYLWVFLYSELTF